MFPLLLLAYTQLAAAGTLPRAAAAPTWSYTGCYLDGVNSRTLGYSSYSDYSVQTIQTCTTYCSNNGFVYAGLEYGTECYCDFALPSTAVQKPETDCSMPCAGNSSQICGNGDRLSVYYNGGSTSKPSTNPGPPGWTFLSCYTDSSAARTLGTSMALNGATTVAACTMACGKAGYAMAGLEYGNECYCDAMIRNTPETATSGCDMVCAGNQTEYCGGSNRIDVYSLNAATTPPTNPAAPPTGWKALGCFTDDAGARTLGTQNEGPGGYLNMTIEGCLGVCQGMGLAYAGLEYSQECYCGGAILNAGSCAADQSTCYMPCRGDTSETCGGPNRLNVYYAGSDSGVKACSAGGIVTSLSSTVSSSTVSSTTASSVTSTTTASSTTSTISTSSTSSSATSTAIPATTSSATTTSTSSSTTTTSPTASSTVCPSFWTNILQDLAPLTKDSTTNLCTDFARAAIRYAFHDAATYSSKLPTYAPASGGADGSLLLSSSEITRADNAGLGDYHNILTQKFSQYKAAGYAVGAADLIQVAGALAVLACPGGRIGRVLVGRTDTTQAAPDGLLPQAFGAGADHDTILSLFADKGFSARDLAALIGAHSTSKANFQTANNLPKGIPQDTTPGAWDVSYYNETYFPPTDGSIGRFDSDVNLSNASTTVGKQFKSFVGAQGAWGASFSSAFQTMSTLGIPTAKRRALLDCTAVVVAVMPPS